MTETTELDGVVIGPGQAGLFSETGVGWPEGNETRVDAVIWCTGFRYARDHLAPLGVVGADGIGVTAVDYGTGA